MPRRGISYNDLLENIEATAQVPEPVKVPAKGPDPKIADEMNAKKRAIELKERRWVEWQEAVLLTLEAIRKQESMQSRILMRLLKRKLQENTKGETFESRLTLQPSKPVFQLDFIGQPHINEQTDMGTIEVPYCPVKIIIIENQHDTQTLNYYINPRYTNLMRASLTLSPGQITKHETVPHNIARINLLNKGSTAMTVRVWAIV